MTDPAIADEKTSRTLFQIVPVGNSPLLADVAVVGQSGVGLSSLLHHIVNERFGQMVKDTVSVCLKNIKMKQYVKLKFVTEFKHSNIPPFICLLYDITDSKSLETIKTPSIVEEITKVTFPAEGARKVTCFLIACKHDLARQDSVPYYVGANLALQLGAIYIETSAATGYGVSNLLDAICSLVIADEDNFVQEVPSVLQCSESLVSNIINVLIVGDKLVGKSSLVRCIDGKPFEEEYLASGVVEFDEVYFKIAGGIRIITWCINCAKELRSFYKVEMPVIVLFDVTDLDSFNNTNSWLQCINELTPPVINCVLVGTKTDLHTEKKGNFLEASRLAHKYGTTYFEISSKTGLGIKNLLTAIAPPNMNFDYDIDKQSVKQKLSIKKTYKVVILGDTLVGKTRVLYSLLDMDTEKFTRPTTGSTFNKCDVISCDKLSHEVAIWDTNGMERLRQTTFKLFCRGSDVIVILFNVVERGTFTNVQTIWLEGVSHHCVNVKVIIVGNITDISEQTHRKVSTDEASSFAKSVHAKFIEVNCQDKTGVKNLRSELVHYEDDFLWNRKETKTSETDQDHQKETSSEQDERTEIKKGCKNM